MVSAAKCVGKEMLFPLLSGFRWWWHYTIAEAFEGDIMVYIK
jgi:hypothetical protein